MSMWKLAAGEFDGLYSDEDLRFIERRRKGGAAAKSQPQPQPRNGSAPAPKRGGRPVGMPDKNVSAKDAEEFHRRLNGGRGGSGSSEPNPFAGLL